VELLNEIKPRRIVTTCPHCLHTLKNEYPAFGGNYEVIHHSQLINELIASGKLHLQPQPQTETNHAAIFTYHDPCYLGRHNGIYADPRQVLKDVTTNLIEMPRHSDKSFCCGAGGTQMWKEEEHGIARVSAVRVTEARAAGAQTMAVACPFCMIMLTDAAKADGEMVKVVDVAEIIAERIK